MNDQRSLAEQIEDLHRYATQEGMYDAADWLAFKWSRRNLDPKDPLTPGFTRNEAGMVIRGPYPKRAGEDTVELYDESH